MKPNSRETEKGDDIKTMKVNAVIESVQKFSTKTFSKPCKVITVKKEEEGWVSLMEIVVEDEEMRKYARTPIVGLWEVRIDNGNNVTSFERKGLREVTSFKYETEE